MTRNSIEPRSTADLLADAERFDRWAERTLWNTEICANFRRLAEEARAQAKAASN